jgi:hypothetical protein
MDVYGMDFTSRPTHRKPITCLHCRLENGVLRANELRLFTDFAAFEAKLRRPGPWIAGLDFPFGLPRKFIENIGWPRSWSGYVEHIARLGRDRFRAALEDYRRDRPAGDKEHRRATDIAAGSISPQKLYGTPVALMFFEGAQRLVNAGVTIPQLQYGDPARIAIEAYPGAAARKLIGPRSYKNDARAKQTPAHEQARREMLERLTSAEVCERLGFAVEASSDLCDDPGADTLDALLCAVQAAWAWRHRAQGYGAPAVTDPLEGWIANPPL